MINILGTIPNEIFDLNLTSFNYMYYNMEGNFSLTTNTNTKINLIHLCYEYYLKAPTGYPTSQPSLRICPAGTYHEVEGLGNCKECLAGTYSDEVGALSSDTCKLCPSGRTTDLPGATSIDDCIDVQSNLIF